MLIDYRTVALNDPSADAHRTVDSSLVFADLPEDREFLSNLTRDWKPIPAELLGATTRQNFTCYARLPIEE